MNIQIHFFNKKKQTKCNTAPTKQIIKEKVAIIIPKKNIKLANKRNKIRRQIRAILHKNKLIFNKKLIIKYLEKNQKTEFKELEKTILTNIRSLN